MPYYCAYCFNDEHFIRDFSLSFVYEIDGDDEVIDGTVEKLDVSEHLVCIDCMYDNVKKIDDLKQLEKIRKKAIKDSKNR